jgi:hypothetical protein
MFLMAFRVSLLNLSFVVLFYFSPSSLFLLLFHRVALLLSCCACPQVCIMLGIIITYYNYKFQFFKKQKKYEKGPILQCEQMKGEF